MAGALNDVTVLDAATLFAGPLAAILFGDSGADIIKIEHPVKGDPSRGHVGHPEVIAQAWFATRAGRAEHADLLDRHVAAWIGERDAAEVITAFEQAQAAVAPVYDIADIMADPSSRRSIR